MVDMQWCFPASRIFWLLQSLTQVHVRNLWLGLIYMCFVSRDVRLRRGVAAFQGRPLAPHWVRRGRQCGIVPRCISKVTTERADYASSASDSNVLRLPIKQELTPKDVVDVFDYARNLRQKCALRLAVSHPEAEGGNVTLKGQVPVPVCHGHESCDTKVFQTCVTRRSR
jgi:hypothetical protein